MSFASQNKMLWEYRSALARLVNRIAGLKHEQEIKQDTCMAVFVSVAIVETFLNAWFQILVRERPHTEHLGTVTADLKKRKSLGRKIHEWPRRLFGEKFDVKRGAGQEFDALRSTRNTLMHFASFEVVELPGRNFIMGAADTSAYSGLTAESAQKAYETSVRTVAYLLRLGGCTDETLPGQIHHWLGLVPGTYDIPLS